MERKELLASPEYWTTSIQILLYNCAEEFMKATGKNKTQLAEHLGVSKGYVSQLLNGDYDHKLSKLVELSLAFGYVPKIDFVPTEEFIKMDAFKASNKGGKYSVSIGVKPINNGLSSNYGSFEAEESKSVA